MAVTKPGWLKNSIAKTDGYYSPKGEKLKGSRLTQEQVDAWNGVEKKKKAPKKKKAVDAPVVEETVTLEEVVVETVEAPGVTTSTVEVEEAPKPTVSKLTSLFNK